MVKKIKKDMLGQRITPPIYRMKRSKDKKLIMEPVLNKVNKYKTIEDQVEYLTDKIQEFKSIKPSRIEVPLELSRGVDKRFFKKYKMGLVSEVINYLEALKKTLKERQTGQWKKKELPPPQPPLTSVQRTIKEINRKSAKIIPDKEVEFIKGVLKNKSRSVVEDKQVREALRKAAPTIPKSLFDVLIEDILNQKKIKK